MTLARLSITLLLVAGALCLLIGVARAAESERTTGWRLLICEDGRECELRGKVLSGPTACSIDMASIANVLPKATRVSCVKVVEDGDDRLPIWQPGDRGRTVGGMPYRVLCTDARGKRGPIIALVTIAEEEMAGRFDAEGRHQSLPPSYNLTPPPARSAP